MYLSKSVTTPAGIAVTAWAITSMQVLPGAGVVNVFLGGFLSSTSIGADTPLETRFFRFVAADLGVSDITTATQAEIYAAITKQVSATGSTDPLNGATTGN